MMVAPLRLFRRGAVAAAERISAESVPSLFGLAKPLKRKQVLWFVGFAPGRAGL